MKSCSVLFRTSMLMLLISYQVCTVWIQELTNLQPPIIAPSHGPSYDLVQTIVHQSCVPFFVIEMKSYKPEAEFPIIHHRRTALKGLRLIGHEMRVQHLWNVVAWMRKKSRQKTKLWRLNKRVHRQIKQIEQQLLLRTVTISIYSSATSASSY